MANYDMTLNAFKTAIAAKKVSVIGHNITEHRETKSGPDKTVVRNPTF